MVSLEEHGVEFGATLPSDALILTGNNWIGALDAWVPSASEPVTKPSSFYVTLVVVTKKAVASLFTQQ